MSGHRTVVLLAAVTWIATFSPSRLSGQADAPAEATGPAAAPSLEPFERLIGTWVSGETIQTFEWGVGRLAVRARSEIQSDSTRRLVSEGLFLLDPTRDEIRGYFVAVDMPVSYFEYAVRWDGDTMLADLTTTGPDGATQRYTETWAFSADRFEWTLHDPEKPSAPVMAATFARVPDEPR